MTVPVRIHRPRSSPAHAFFLPASPDSKGSPLNPRADGPASNLESYFNPRQLQSSPPVQLRIYQSHLLPSALAHSRAPSVPPTPRSPLYPTALTYPTTMPLAPSDSVDNFLSWLAAPAPAGVQGGAAAVPKAAVGHLRELARNPLEDISRPLLAPGGGAPPTAASTGKAK
ncbi:hypothetical protein DFH11DRAFT_1316618 [Phellopilus nigrolimitatus]|nr:hypothetical protein DFH11DRAFT_1316618 [Phellopilus nigrolimitatus]